MRLAISADLHWGHARGGQATLLLRDYLLKQPPDVFILAGDVGAGSFFGECLGLFGELNCKKALVPGNHDIWVEEKDPRGDSLQVYRHHIPEVCAEFGFHLLDQGPLVLQENGLALAGTMNWYDYSWSIEQLRQRLPDWQHRLETKTFSRGRHNDARFVRWPLDDLQFTAQLVQTFEQHLDDAMRQCGQVVVVAHHPPFYGMGFPRNGPLSDDGLLWDAFCGNAALESVLTRHAQSIPLAFCGHTHRERESMLKSIRGYNIGGDYHFKRLLTVDWPSSTVESHVFGDPNR